MDENDLRELVAKGKSQREIAKLRNRSQASVKHWLAKYGFRTKASIGRNKKGEGKKTRKRRDDSMVDPCAICAGPVQRKGAYCWSCLVRIRRLMNKVKAIAYLGGKCMRCGWEGAPATYDFHHQDGGKKDFTISQRSTNSWKSLKKELDKCELLCKMCHAIEHSKHEDEPLIRAVEQLLVKQVG